MRGLLAIIFFTVPLFVLTAYGALIPKEDLCLGGVVHTPGCNPPGKRAAEATPLAEH
ncbi:hypothetical protein V8D89_008723 [Ganoderma adspersum]